MPNKYKPNIYKIDEIYLKEIVFERNVECTDVTIFGYYHNTISEELIRIDYLIEFSMLTDLLIFANEKGEPVIEAISEKLSADLEEDPIIIDVENIFGEPLKIENILIQIYIPFEENEKGEWVESDDKTFYIIDSIEQHDLLDRALEYMSQQPNTEEIKLSELNLLLNNSYLFYKKLLKFGVSKKSARKKSGLKNELLFRIASLNHKLNSKNN